MFKEYSRYYNYKSLRREANICSGLLPARKHADYWHNKSIEKSWRNLINECALAGQHQARLEAVLPLRRLKEKLTKIEKIGLLWRY